MIYTTVLQKNHCINIYSPFFESPFQNIRRLPQGGARSTGATGCVTIINSNNQLKHIAHVIGFDVAA